MTVNALLFLLSGMCFVTVSVRHWRRLWSHARLINWCRWTWSRFNIASLHWNVVWTANARCVFVGSVQFSL